MGLTLKIYAETFDGDRWHAAPAELYVEQFFGHPTGFSWIEPKSIHADRNDSLSEILGMRLSLEELISIAPQPRGFPVDISDELADHFARSFLPHWQEEQENRQHFRQQIRDVKFSQTWFLLSELLSFDWYGHQKQHFGRVKQEDAFLFGEGQQPFPIEAWGKFVREFGSQEPCKPGYTRVSWTETYADKAGSQFMDALSFLQTLGQPHQVRMIAWHVA